MADIKGGYVAGTPTITGTPNVGFRMGTEGGLKTLASATKGTFYLTTDTHRLYIGNDDGSLSPVNQGVITVSDLSSISNAIPGQFYYITNGNILATWSGGRWVQINPDTAVTAVSNDVDAVTGGASIVTTITQEGNKSGQIQSEAVTFKGGNKVSVSNSGKAISVATGDYGLSTSGEQNAVNVDLTYKAPGATSATTAESVTLKSSGGLKITQSGKEITFDGTDLVNDINGTDLKDTGTFQEDASGFTLILEKQTGAQITAKFTPEITVGKDASEKKTVDFKNGVATLDVYTAAEVDKIINDTKLDLNALVYRGTVGTTGATVKELPQSNVQIGDVYMSDGTASVKLTATGTAVKYDAGTLFIATGTETNGVIAANAVTWTRVDNYNSNTIVEVGLGEANKISFTNKTGQVEEFLGSYKVIGAGDNNTNDIIKTTQTLAGTDNKEKTITISHATSGFTSTTTATAADGTSDDVLFAGVALGTLTADKYGHVKTVAEKAITVPTEKFDKPADGTTTSTVTVTESSGVYTATTSDTLTLVVGNREIDSITMKNQVKSGSLKIEGNSTSTMEINLVWGTF